MLIRRFVILFIVTLLTGQFFCNTANAQFTDSTHHYINLTATGTINRTNGSSSYVFANGLKFSTRKEKWQLNSTNAWLYGEQQRVLTNNDFSSFWDFNFYPNGRKKLYYWGLVSYEKSYSLKLNSRFQSGAGIAWSIIDDKNNYLNLSDGILYEKSNLSLTDSTNDKYNTFRNSFRLRFRHTIKDIVTIDGINFLQNSLSNKEDYIIKVNLNLSVKLRKWLSLTSSFTYNKLNRTASENLLFTYGITAEKYF